MDNQIDILSVQQQVKLLLAYNVGEVLDLLHKHLLESDYFNELVLFLAQYNDLNRSARFDRLNDQEVQKTMNRIRLAIMEFIDRRNTPTFDWEAIFGELSTDNRFKHLIEHKTDRIEFRGMSENEVLEFERLEFSWQNLLLSRQPAVDEPLLHLLEALSLTQDRLGLSRNFVQVSGSADMDRELYRIATALAQALERTFTIEQQDRPALLEFLHHCIDESLAVPATG